MEPENKHIIYTAADIQKYLSGKLGPAEMHAMEKAALEDDFLAEAMEGYDRMQQKDWEKQLILLKGDFAKGQTAKVILMKPDTRYTMWKFAAAVLIICSGVAVTYTLTNKNAPKNNTIAAINKKEDPVISSDKETNAVDSSTKAIIAITSTTDAKKRSIVAQRDQKKLADSEFIYRPGTSEKKEIVKEAGGGYRDEILKESTDYATTNAAPIIQQNKLKQYEVESKAAANVAPPKKIAAIANQKFNAQVVGPDGVPLPFANISIPNENFGTYADAKGNFRLVSSDSLLNIEIKSAGYISRNFILKNDHTPNKIMLMEDALALKDKTIVVTAYGKRRKAVLVPDPVINVEPADGWNNYDTYIINNLSIPDNIIQKKIHGEVEVSFEVQSDGTLTNFRIDKSLCDDCDAAALRVIKEGPRWKVKKGNKATAKVKVRF